MKLRRLVFPVFILLMAVLMSSCEKGSLIHTVDSLLTPPLYYSEYEGLVSAFNSELEGNVILSNPAGGDHLSAITVSDLNGDSAEDAIILYRNTLESNTVQLSVFSFAEGVWKKSVSFNGYGNVVDSLTVEDMDGDGISEIVVVWNYQGIGNAKVFTVYRSLSDSSSYEEIKTQTCDAVEIADMDDDRQSEVLYILSENSGNIIKRTANLIKLSKKDFVTMGSVSLDPNVGAYVSVKREKYNSHYPMKVYFDAEKNSNMMITEVVYWDSEKKTLIAPMFDGKTDSNSVTLRYEQIHCADINNDGMIEIPVQSPPSEKTEETSSPEGAAEAKPLPADDTLPVTNWVYFVGLMPASQLSTWVNLQDGYYIRLDNDKGKDYVVRESEEDGVHYYQVCSGKTVLFSVFTVSRKDYESGNYSSDVDILKFTDKVILAKTEAAGEKQGFDAEQIRKTVVKLP